MDFNDSLTELFERAMRKFKHLDIDNSQQKAFTLSPTGSLQLKKKYSHKISLTKRKNLTLEYHNPALHGLHSLALTKKPRFTYETGILEFGLLFKEISLKSEQYSIAIHNKSLPFKKKSKHYNDFQVTFPKLTFDFALKFDPDLSGRNPSISASGSTCFFHTPHFNCKLGSLLNICAIATLPVFKKIISKKIEEAFSTIMTAQVAKIYKGQQAFIETLSSVHQMKQEQGEHCFTKTPRLFTAFNEIGTLPLPTLWEVPSVKCNTLKKCGVKEIIEKCRTGDLLLFSGTAPSSQRIRRLTQCPYSHVVMIVKEPEFCDGTPLIWQATASAHHGVLREHELKAGIQLNPFMQMINEYRDDAPGAIVAYRQLDHGITDPEKRETFRLDLINYIQRMDGQPYTQDMDKLYLKGLFEIEEPGFDYYCAGLVAESLITYGVLKPTFLQHQYAPRDFSTLQKNVPFTDHHQYIDDEIIITFDEQLKYRFE